MWAEGGRRGGERLEVLALWCGEVHGHRLEGEGT